MTTIEDFAETFKDIQDGLIRDYGTDVPEDQVAPCHILHRELGLGETPADDEVEMLDRIEEQTGERPPEGLIDLTIEHHALHQFFRQIKMEAIVRGIDVDTLMMVIFATGRRYGLREAAEMLGDEPSA